MLKKNLILIFFFYLLTLCQTSFFIPFGTFSFAPNLVLVFLFLLIFFGKHSRNEVFLWSFIAGFFLDLSAYTFFGRSIAILFLESFFILKIFEALRKPNVFFFGLSFFLFLFFYHTALSGFDYFLRQSPLAFFERYVLVEIVLSSFLAILGFYLFPICSNLLLQKSLKIKK